MSDLLLRTIIIEIKISGNKKYNFSYQQHTNQYRHLLPIVQQAIN